MEYQNGITVCPMRLKVLYTFDNENKTNCLARWPHVLDIQTAYLDETTQVGVIELRTCIQAIVSASPELVAQLGKDYTVYAYDYSEYETPLVGQGMLSWVLASTSPTPDAPAHQSKTMVTGRVCKNPLGLFSGGTQETLEVKLRLVPVPTVMQNEYCDNMQKYRESSNVNPHDFDAQSWTKFVRQNPGLMESRNQQSASPIDQSGIERFHQLLSEGSTPRDFDLCTLPPTESVRSASPALSYAPSSVSTPGGSRAQGQQQRPHTKQGMPQSDVIRPSSSASMRDTDLSLQTSYNPRRESIQSGYGSPGEELAEPQPRKRAKVFQMNWTGKSDMNIERQPSSLRVAASTAASVRIHRPTPINLSSATQQSNEEPGRPPTPISRPTDLRPRGRLPPSTLRESSANSGSSYTSPYSMSDQHPATDQTAYSPDESYQGLFEASLTMPSSPPIMDSRLPTRSSPVLPPITLDTDSGFMSGGFEDLLDDDVATPWDDCRMADSNDITQNDLPVRPAIQSSSPASAMGTVHENTKDSLNERKEGASKDAPPSLSRLATSAGSRPSSRASSRQLKPLAPAAVPISQSEVEQLISAIPASDPIAPTQPPLPRSLTWVGPMSDSPVAETPGPGVSRENKVRGAAARRQKQVKSRLDQAIRAGEIPPYCENCGSIDTPTWRKAWTKEFQGGDELAREITADSRTLFWETLERDDQDKVSKFKVYRRSVTDSEIEFWAQMLFCNPCGLWLHKCKGMRPKSMWDQQKAPQPKKKRPSRSRKGGPLSSLSPATRTRSKVAQNKATASSPAPTEASSVHDETTPNVTNDDDNDNDQDEEAEAPPTKRRRANSAQPRRSTDTAESRWDEQDAMEALRRAIQSSPARNMEVRNVPVSNEDDNLTPNPVRRALFPHAQTEGSLKELDGSAVNTCSPRRSPRIASKSQKRTEEKENGAPTRHSSLESLFESPTMDCDLPSSPTPRRRSARPTSLNDKRVSLPCNSPLANKRKEASVTTPTRPSAERSHRVQESQGSARRQRRCPNKQSRPHSPSIPSIPDDGLHSEAFESLDGMILDIFDNASSRPNPLLQFDNDKFSSDNWTDWLPSDQASPLASDDGPAHPSDDLINAILSDSDIHKESLHNSEFNPFTFGVSGVPDSGFFSSDALHADPTDLESKNKASGEHAERQTASPAS